MDYSLGSSVFFCLIWRGNQILYSQGGDGDQEALAAAAVKTAPSFHSRYSHTTGNRTFAFLIDDDGHTFFLIADSSTGSAAAFRILEHMRDEFHRASKNGVRHELFPIIRRFIASLKTFSRSDGDENIKGVANELLIDMPVSPVGSMPLQKTLSSRVCTQQNGQRMWRRHVKIVVTFDVLICLVLFGIWLTVCRGFQCTA